MSGGLKLDNIIFTGRSYDEYIRMFNLTAKEVQTQTFFICPAGAASFPAIANRGGHVVAGDILYGASLVELEDRGRASIKTIRSGMRNAQNG